MTRTYGKIREMGLGDGWIIPELEPHVRIRLKALFPRIAKTAQPPFVLIGGASLEADLLWFTSRYPLEISDEDQAKLETRTQLFETQQNELAQLLSKDWKPSTVSGFREGEAPYDYQAQAAELARRKGSLLLMDDLGLGKAQPLTALILTPTCWTTMGQMRVGSTVIGRDGRVHKVTGVYPQGLKAAYRVTFSDGATTECCDEHLWTVRDQNRRLRNKGWAVKPLKDIIRQKWLNKAGQPKWEIPLMDAPEFSHRSNPLIPAYVLGVLIGDGYLVGSTVTFSVPALKQEILDRVAGIIGAERLSGPHGTESSPQWHILGEKRGENEYRRHLARLGLDVPSTRRFIPDAYLWTSAAERFELLRGLMDTDGSAHRGRVAYHTCSPQLAVDVAHLVRSLGGTARVREYDRTDEGKSREWQVAIRINECPFTVSYKANGCPAKNEHARPRRYIRDIVYIGEKPQQCIAVDTPDRTYVTDSFIVTHNTVSGIATFAGQPLLLPALIVPQTHLVTQWKEKIEEFTHHTVHVFNKATPYALPPADVYICPYSKLGGWCDFGGNAKADRDFRTIIFDEVQELRRGSQSQKGAAAKAFRQSAVVAVGLSATPIYNYGSEIFEIINLLSPGALGSWDDFTREYCHCDSSGHWIVDDPQALGTYLRENALALRRTQEDVGHEAPPLNVISHEIDYDAKVLDEDAELMRNLAIKVTTGSFTERGHAARDFDLRMRKATGIAKAPHVAAFVKLLLDAGDPVVLFGWHRDVYDIWLTKLAKYNPILYTGTESPAQKDRAKKAFINGHTNLLILSLRSGAGLDGLQNRGHVVVFGELDWSPKVHEQCAGRLRRPGQTKQVDAIYLTTDGGADPAIVGVLGLKASQSQGIVDPLSAPADQHSDGSRIKQLAELYLAGKSREYVPLPVTQDLEPDVLDLFGEVA